MKFLKHLLICSLVAASPSVFGLTGPDAAETEPEESLQTMFPDGLEDRQGNKVSLDKLDGKIVGVYFSAKWCPPCRKFTPKLVEYRNKHNDDFEVVFLSSDHTEEAKLKYMEDAKMDWYTVDYDGEVKEKLSSKWSVRGIPTLVLLKDGKTLTTEGRRLIESNTDIEKIKTARVETEEYMCGNCDKTHTRTKLVMAE